MRLLLSLCLFPALALAGSHLTFETTPPSQISIDGKPYGKTPIKKRAFPSGRHQVLLVLKEKGTQYEFQISLKDEKHTLCTYDFETGMQRCVEEKILTPVPQTEIKIEP